MLYANKWQYEELNKCPQTLTVFSRQIIGNHIFNLDYPENNPQSLFIKELLTYWHFRLFAILCIDSLDLYTDIVAILALFNCNWSLVDLSFCYESFYENLFCQLIEKRFVYEIS